MRPELSECLFYHTMDLPGFGQISGSWDLRGRFDEYVGQVDLAGCTVLDVGTASGFLSFEAERRGAAVTSFDADTAEYFQFIQVDGALSLAEAEERHRRIRNSYALAHAALSSTARLVLGDARQLSTYVQPHHTVLLGQILVHQRDPLGFLQEAAAVAQQRIIIVEGSYHAEDHPQARFIGSRQVPYAWWHFSHALYREWLDLLGFDLSSITRASYPCVDANTQEELWTFVAERR